MLSNSNPNVILKAVILLSAYGNNCGKIFSLEKAFREFKLEYRKLVEKVETQPKIAKSLNCVFRK